jgi:hypothetical protein
LVLTAAIRAGASGGRAPFDGLKPLKATSAAKTANARVHDNRGGGGIEVLGERPTSRVQNSYAELTDRYEQISSNGWSSLSSRKSALAMTKFVAFVNVDRRLLNLLTR